MSSLGAKYLLPETTCLLAEFTTKRHYAVYHLKAKLPLADSTGYIVNKFEHVGEGGTCTVRSTLNKFEQAGALCREPSPNGQNDWQTHMTEKATFPQLRWQAVKKSWQIELNLTIKRKWDVSLNLRLTFGKRCCTCRTCTLARRGCRAALLRYTCGRHTHHCCTGFYRSCYIRRARQLQKK